LATTYAEGSPSAGKSTCRADYDRLSSDRSPYLLSARAAAKLTIPWLVPEDGTTAATRFPTPFQSIGARGVNNLASRLLLTLFPPNAPFFEFRVDPYALEQISNVKNAEEQVKKNLIRASEAILSRMETDGFRVAAHEALRHLVVAGNALVFYGKEAARVYHLDQYVVERDPLDDHPILIIVHEKIAEDSVPEEIRQEVAGRPTTSEGERTIASTEKRFDLYTHCSFDRDADKWRCYQEIAGVYVPGSRVSRSAERFEYLPLRGNVVSGENYGRGYVEEYQGDLQSAEGLAQAVVEGAAACARLLFFVDPNSLVDVAELARKPNGAFVEGNADHVKPLQVQKFADFQVAGATANAIEARLSYAFLLNSAVQRQGERVTAEEIRYMAEELEQALGGIYTLLSREFQLPVVRLLTARMQAEGNLPKISKKVIRPSVVTGIEALGRGNDLNRLRVATAAFGEALVNPAIAQYVDMTELGQRIFNAAGVRSDGLLKTAEEIAAEQQRAQQQALMQQATGPAINQIGGAVRESIKAPGGAPQ
jgi:hypothetical protein